VHHSVFLANDLRDSVFGDLCWERTRAWTFSMTVLLPRRNSGLVRLVEFPVPYQARSRPMNLFRTYHQLRKFENQWISSQQGSWLTIVNVIPWCPSGCICFIAKYSPVLTVHRIRIYESLLQFPDYSTQRDCEPVSRGRTRSLLHEVHLLSEKAWSDSKLGLSVLRLLLVDK
jgi:hypothetical protein